MSLINTLVNKLLLLYVNLDAKIMIFLSLQIVFTKKRRPQPPFLSYDVSKTYFTMNFMVFSKPLALTVTK